MDEEDEQPREIKSLGGMLRIPTPKKVRGIHSELHEFIDETRKEWGDKLPFGRWLGLLKDIPMHVLYRTRGSIRDSNAKTPAKLFFWKIKEWKKPKDGKTPSYPQLSLDKGGQKE